MMKALFKNLAISLFASVVLFAGLEGIAFMARVPAGSNHFVEAIVMREGLRVEKPADEIRIFAYGESTMHGAHYGPVSNPARWMEVYLKDFLPHKKMKIVNFARLGRGSDHILKIFKDTVQYKPDIAVFYLGHNDFTPRNRKDEVERERAGVRFKLKTLIQKSRIFSAIWRRIIHIKMVADENVVREEVGYDVIETGVHTAVSEKYELRQSDDFYRENLAFLKRNVQEMINKGKSHGVAQIFFVPAANLKDFKPNRSLHRKDITDDELALWQQLYLDGLKAQEEGRPEEAFIMFEAAYGLDAEYADLLFEMGRNRLQAGDRDQALRYFKEARDKDAIIRRAPSDVVRIFKELPQSEDLVVIDTEDLLKGRVKEDILGEPLIEDNVHFSLRGHSLLGRALAGEIARAGWIAPEQAWHWEAQRSFEEILAEIGVDQELILSAYLKMVHYFGPRFPNRIRFAQKALELEPESPLALRSLAWTYWLMKEKSKAVDVYKKLEAVDPESLETVFEGRPNIKKVFLAKAS